MRRILLCVAMLALLMPGLAAADGDTVVIEMVNNSFKPDELEITAGTTVRWVNMERRTSHDVFFPDEEVASERLFPEEYFERRFDEPGTYEYHCRPHEDRGMHGVIRVIAKD